MLKRSFRSFKPKSRRAMQQGVVRSTCEPMEARVLLASDPASIVWTNRSTTNGGGAGDFDHFGVVFGTFAPTVRIVVDTVIAQYQTMIGSFNYASSNHHFSLNLSMSTTDGGFGASATLDGNLNGKPDAGTVSINLGQLTPDPNDANGWFIDPTPADSVEFEGTISNAFTGNAQSGSPAAGKSDFYSFVAAEITHCLGQYGSALSGWSSLTTNTTSNDQLMPGKLWVFRGPDIKHLMTSDNGGTSDFGAAIHTAEPQNFTFQGDTYFSTDDTGNPQSSAGQRSLVDNIHALMFKDAYGYSTVNPASQGTFYSVLGSNTKALLVRGGDFTTGQSPSNDVIDIYRTGNILSVSVNIGNDVPGSGSFAGVGNLPSFVTNYNISQISSIVVQAGAGDDTIFVDSLPTNMPVTIQGGLGNDTVNIGDGDVDAHILSDVFVQGDVGNDRLNVNDGQDDVGNDSYTIDGYQLTKDNAHFIRMDTTVESEYITGSPNNDVVSLLATPASQLTFDGRNGNDSIYLSNGDLNTIASPASIIGGAGNDTLYLLDDSRPTANLYDLFSAQASSSGFFVATWDPSVESVVLNASPNNDQIVLEAGGGSTGFTLNGLAGNDTIVVSVSSYTSVTPGGAAVQINGGTGTDTVRVEDTYVNPSTINISSTSFSRTFAPAYTYATVEGLTWNGGSGNELFDVTSAIAATPITLNGGSGNDTFMNGTVADHELFLLLGTLTIDGGTGTNVLVASDNETPIAHTYTLTGSTIVQSDANSTISYTNLSAVTFIAGFSNDTINVNGTHVGTSLTVNSNPGDDTINVNDTAAGSGAGTFVTLTGATGVGQLAVGDTVRVNADSVGSAAAHFAASQSANAVNVLNGGTLVMETEGNRLLTARTLSIANSGKLDLNDNDLIATTTAKVTIQNWIKSAYNFGTWNGAGGIFSTSAKISPSGNTTLGLLSGAEFFNNNGAGTFDGATISGTDVLVKYTYFGDVDFNGAVDSTDYNIIDFGYLTGAIGWANGDVDGSGAIDSTDYNLIDFAFVSQSGVL